MPAYAASAAGRRAAASPPAAGVELQVEQRQQRAGDARLVAQRRLHHREAGVEAGLLAVAGPGAHQGGLAPADAQLDHQPVEAVALRAPVPHRREGRLERGAHVVEHQPVAAGVLQQEGVRPHGGRARAADGEAVLLQRLQPHVVEDGQHVGQRHGVALAVELEAELARVAAGVAIGPHGHRAGRRQRLQRGHVAQGLLRVVQVAVAGGEGVRPIPGQLVAHVLAAGRAQGRLEAIAPGAHRLGDLALQGVGVGRGMVARRDAQHEVHPRQGVVAEARVGGGDAAAPRPRQYGSHPLAHLGVVPVARGVELHRHEAVERVDAGEQPHPRPVVEVQHADGRVVQLPRLDLEQLIARECFEDVPQAFERVLAGRFAHPRQHVGDLAADQRYLPRRLLVGLGGEQADEAHLAGGATRRVVPLDPHVIHVGAPVHPRAQVGLGHH